VYPGNALYRTLPNVSDWPLNEIIRQIDITRSISSRLALGNVFFSLSQIMENVKGIQNEFAIIYQEKAIVPKMNWL
ncbi:unnamed protein product, partial [Rotaria sp. Silwood1]